MGFNLKGLFQGKVKDVLDSAFKGLDNIVTSKEELAKIRLEAEQELNRHAEVIETAYLADVSDARKSNQGIQESDKASWLAKNLPYLIDMFVTLLWGSLTTYLMAVMLHLAPKTAGVDYTAVTAVWGAVSATFGTVINFHRGSSQGSQDKQKMIDKLTKN